jgi:hypothetical protein
LLRLRRFIDPLACFIWARVDPFPRETILYAIQKVSGPNWIQVEASQTLQEVSFHSKTWTNWKQEGPSLGPSIFYDPFHAKLRSFGTQNPNMPGRNQVEQGQQPSLILARNIVSKKLEQFGTKPGTTRFVCPSHTRPPLLSLATPSPLIIPEEDLQWCSGCSEIPRACPCFIRIAWGRG